MMSRRLSPLAGRQVEGRLTELGKLPQKRWQAKAPARKDFRGNRMVGAGTGRLIQPALKQMFRWDTKTE
jgi:hypothetical protein